MTREKRSAHLQAKVFPSTRERLVQHVKRNSKVRSISDYLFELIERDLLQHEVLEVVNQKIAGGRARN